MAEQNLTIDLAANQQVDLVKSPEVESDSKIARKMLTKASIAYPASGTAQAAMIARLCQEQKLNPMILRSSLLSNSDAIIELLNTAKKIHQNKPRTPTYIDVGQMRRVISEDFEDAAKFIVLPSTILREIEAAYPELLLRYKDQDSREKAYIELANELYERNFRKQK